MADTPTPDTPNPDTPNPDALKAIKDAARRDAFARRAEFTADAARAADAVRDANRHLALALASRSDLPLSGFLPMGTEIDPRPTMSAWAGAAVGVPLIAAKAQPLDFAVWTPETPLIDGPFGTQAPADPVRMVPQVLIVPLLAFDRRGYRLGYGGGFYDRTLEELRRNRPTFAVGFAFAAQEAAGVPIEATDQPLDLIVTETGAIQPVT